VADAHARDRDTTKVGGSGPNFRLQSQAAVFKCPKFLRPSSEHWLPAGGEPLAVATSKTNEFDNAATPTLRSWELCDTLPIPSVNLLPQEALADQL